MSKIKVQVGNANKNTPASDKDEVDLDLSVINSFLDISIKNSHNELKGQIDGISSKLQAINDILTKIPQKEIGFFDSHKKNLKSPNVLASFVAVIFGWIGLWFGGWFADWQLQKQKQNEILQEHKDVENTDKMAKNLEKRGYNITKTK